MLTVDKSQKMWYREKVGQMHLVHLSHIRIGN